jgi:hypothetical protein
MPHNFGVGIHTGRQSLTRAAWQPPAIDEVGGVRGFAGPTRQGGVGVLEGEKAEAWIQRVRVPGYKAAIERVLVISVEAFDWNCPEHITPRFTEDEIRDALAPMEILMQELEHENERLRKRLALDRFPERLAGADSWAGLKGLD